MEIHPVRNLVGEIMFMDKENKISNGAGQIKIIKSLLEQILEKLTVSGEVEIVDDGECPCFVIRTREAGVLIGENGQHLVALNHLLKKLCECEFKRQNLEDVRFFFKHGACATFTLCPFWNKVLFFTHKPYVCAVFRKKRRDMLYYLGVEKDLVVDVPKESLLEHGKISHDSEEFTRGAGGILAQIFQHELDHLEGVLFTDKAKDLVEVTPEELAEQSQIR